MENFASLTGFTDYLASTALQKLENQCWQWSEQMGYTQVRLPFVEARSLFERGVGGGTDVVEKEMFSLQNSENVLRPEGTAQAMRAWLAAGGVRYGPVRWAYCGPMFRNERPQAGRFRQFQQFGCEAILMKEGPGDADLLIGLNDLFVTLGIREKLVLNINTLGTTAERKLYRDALVDWLTPRSSQLDATSQKRLASNPLRIWDSKDSGTRALMTNAPRLLDFLGVESLAQWRAITALLDASGVKYKVDNSLMRGLDYYNGLVFEWVTFEDKAQNAVAAGGRYDGLAETIGGSAPTPAFGFAIGLERVLALQSTDINTERRGCFLIAMAGCDSYALQVARSYRLRGDMVVLGDVGSKLTKQVQRADKLGMRYVLIVGEAEQTTGTLTVKDLATGEQETLAFAP